MTHWTEQLAEIWNSSSVQLAFFVTQLITYVDREKCTEHAEAWLHTNWTHTDDVHAQLKLNRNITPECIVFVAVSLGGPWRYGMNIPNVLAGDRRRDTTARHVFVAIYNPEFNQLYTLGVLRTHDDCITLCTPDPVAIYSLERHMNEGPARPHMQVLYSGPLEPGHIARLKNLVTAGTRPVQSYMNSSFGEGYAAILQSAPFSNLSRSCDPARPWNCTGLAEYLFPEYISCTCRVTGYMLPGCCKLHPKLDKDERKKWEVLLTSVWPDRKAAVSSAMRQITAVSSPRDIERIASRVMETIAPDGTLVESKLQQYFGMERPTPAGRLSGNAPPNSFEYLLPQLVALIQLQEMGLPKSTLVQVGETMKEKDQTLEQKRQNLRVLGRQLDRQRLATQYPSRHLSEPDEPVTTFQDDKGEQAFPGANASQDDIELEDVIATRGMMTNVEAPPRADDPPTRLDLPPRLDQPVDKPRRRRLQSRVKSKLRGIRRKVTPTFEKIRHKVTPSRLRFGNPKVRED